MVTSTRIRGWAGLVAILGVEQLEDRDSTVRRIGDSLGVLHTNSHFAVEVSKKEAVMDASSRRELASTVTPSVGVVGNKCMEAHSSITLLRAHSYVNR